MASPACERPGSSTTASKKQIFSFLFKGVGPNWAGAFGVYTAKLARKFNEPPAKINQPLTMDWEKLA